MITKEAIEAAARAACEDNVQRIHKASHDSGSSASMSGSEYYMYPPHGWPDFLASMEAAITTALAAMPTEREIDGGRFEEWTLADFAGQCRMQARENLDPEYSQFMAALSSRLSTLASENESLPQDVVNLVIAAREFWDVAMDESDESAALDCALEAFSSRVPYENDPEEGRAALERT